MSSLAVLRGLYARDDAGLQQLRQLDDTMSSLLLAGQPPLQDVARVLCLFERVHWQPSVLCLERAARWLQACSAHGALEGPAGGATLEGPAGGLTLEGSAGGATLEGSAGGALERSADGETLEVSRGAVECTRALAKAWTSLAMRSVRQPDSVACRTLPGVLRALARCAPAAGTADSARLTIAAELQAVRSAEALEDAERQTGALWDFHCTLSALTALATLCATHLRQFKGIACKHCDVWSMGYMRGKLWVAMMNDR